jgi:hypothetical protein
MLQRLNRRLHDLGATLGQQINVLINPARNRFGKLLRIAT